MDCPGGHAECTANLSPAAPFSEYEMGKDIGTQLGLQDVLVRYVTTDGDAQGAKGVEDAMRALHPLWKVERLADPVHLGQSQFRASNQAVYSDEMFHSKVLEATVACYDRDCSMFAAYSLVCDGGVVSNWWNFSRNLAIYRITALYLCHPNQMKHDQANRIHTDKVTSFCIGKTGQPCNASEGDSK